MLRLAGLLLAGTGAAHFAAPQLFDPISQMGFPDDPRRATYRDGAVDIALGLALTSRRTRVLGLAAAGVYGYWMIDHIRKNRPES
jgi:hypothetical protein